MRALEDLTARLIKLPIDSPELPDCLLAYQRLYQRRARYSLTLGKNLDAINALDEASLNPDMPSETNDCIINMMAPLILETIAKHPTTDLNVPLNSLINLVKIRLLVAKYSFNNIEHSLLEAHGILQSLDKKPPLLAEKVKQCLHAFYDITPLLVNNDIEALVQQVQQRKVFDPYDTAPFTNTLPPMLHMIFYQPDATDIIKQLQTAELNLQGSGITQDYLDLFLTEPPPALGKHTKLTKFILPKGRINATARGHYYSVLGVRLKQMGAIHLAKQAFLAAKDCFLACGTDVSSYQLELYQYLASWHNDEGNPKERQRYDVLMLGILEKWGTTPTPDRTAGNYFLAAAVSARQGYEAQALDYNLNALMCCDDSERERYECFYVRIHPESNKNLVYIELAYAYLKEGLIHQAIRCAGRIETSPKIASSHRNLCLEIFFHVALTKKTLTLEEIQMALACYSEQTKSHQSFDDSVCMAYALKLHAAQLNFAQCVTAAQICYGLHHATEQEDWLRATLRFYRLGLQHAPDKSSVNIPKFIAYCQQYAATPTTLQFAKKVFEKICTAVYYNAEVKREVLEKVGDLELDLKLSSPR